MPTDSVPQQGTLLDDVKHMRDQIKEALDLSSAMASKPIVGIKWQLREECLRPIFNDLTGIINKHSAV